MKINNHEIELNEYEEHDEKYLMLRIDGQDVMHFDEDEIMWMNSALYAVSGGFYRGYWKIKK